MATMYHPEYAGEETVSVATILRIASRDGFALTYSPRTNLFRLASALPVPPRLIAADSSRERRKLEAAAAIDHDDE